jgi:fumarate hydratase, class I
LEVGEPLPDFFKNHPIYYALPAKTPESYAPSSFGSTTAGRMDRFVEQPVGRSIPGYGGKRQPLGCCSRCMSEIWRILSRLNRGPANRFAQDCIRKAEVVEYPELGMEALWRIEVENFPAFIVVDDKGDDFFEELG